MHTQGNPFERALGIVAAGALLALGLIPFTGTAAEAEPGGISWQYSYSSSGYYRGPAETQEGGAEGPQCPNTEGYCYLTLVGTAGASGTFEPLPDEHNFACTDFDLDLRGSVCDPTSSGCFGSWSGTEEWIGETGDGRPAYPHVQFEQFVDPEDEDAEFDPYGPWEYVEDSFACVPVPEEDWVDEEDIWEFSYEIFETLGEPDISFEPNTRTLVHLPTIVHTDYPTEADVASAGAAWVSGQGVGQEPVTINIPLTIDTGRPPAFTGNLRATAGYHWTFAEGGESRRRGRPYEPGRTPASAPGYYVTKAFTGTGEKWVQLDITWTGEVSVGALNVFEPIRPYEMDPARETVDVVEKSNVHAGN